ncbi:hypothetical protein DERP_001804, partial [Dermatophagoides pteronyssinus]
GSKIAFFQANSQFEFKEKPKKKIPIGLDVILFYLVVYSVVASNLENLESKASNADDKKTDFNTFIPLHQQKPNKKPSFFFGSNSNTSNVKTGNKKKKRKPVCTCHLAYDNLMTTASSSTNDLSTNDPSYHMMMMMNNNNHYHQPTTTNLYGSQPIINSNNHYDDNLSLNHCSSTPQHHYSSTTTDRFQHAPYQSFDNQVPVFEHESTNDNNDQRTNLFYTQHYQQQQQQQTEQNSLMNPSTMMMMISSGPLSNNDGDNQQNNHYNHQYQQHHQQYHQQNQSGNNNGYCNYNYSPDLTEHRRRYYSPQLQLSSTEQSMLNDRSLSIVANEQQQRQRRWSEDNNYHQNQINHHEYQNIDPTHHIIDNQSMIIRCQCDHCYYSQSNQNNYLNIKQQQQQQSSSSSSKPRVSFGPSLMYQMDTQQQQQSHPLLFDPMYEYEQQQKQQKLQKKQQRNKSSRLTTELLPLDTQIPLQMMESNMEIFNDKNQHDNNMEINEIFHQGFNYWKRYSFCFDYTINDYRWNKIKITFHTFVHIILLKFQACLAIMYGLVFVAFPDNDLLIDIKDIENIMNCNGLSILFIQMITFFVIYEWTWLNLFIDILHNHRLTTIIHHNIILSFIILLLIQVFHLLLYYIDGRINLIGIMIILPLVTMATIQASLVMGHLLFSINFLIRIQKLFHLSQTISNKSSKTQKLFWNYFHRQYVELYSEIVRLNRTVKIIIFDMEINSKLALILICVFLSRQTYLNLFSISVIMTIFSRFILTIMFYEFSSRLPSYNQLCCQSIIKGLSRSQFSMSNRFFDQHFKRNQKTKDSVRKNLFVQTMSANKFGFTCGQLFFITKFKYIQLLIMNFHLMIKFYKKLCLSSSTKSFGLPQ